jgi:NAD(P)H-nitrite reductase large subunit
MEHVIIGAGPAGGIAAETLRKTDPDARITLIGDEPDIYAAGDVARGKDFCTGGDSVQAVQPTAANHARIAARNMAGRATPHRGSINMNVLASLRLVSASFGQWMGVDGGDSSELSDPESFSFLNLQFQDDVLVGASSLGLTEHVGVVRGLIQSRVRLGAWKARLRKDPTRIMEAYVGRPQAVGHNAGVLIQPRASRRESVRAPAAISHGVVHTEALSVSR